MHTFESSIDSGILAPASVLSENLVKYAVRDRLTPLVRNRVCVAAAGLGSLGTAYLGAKRV